VLKAEILPVAKTSLPSESLLVPFDLELRMIYLVSPIGE
jgi:hypothetical protein